MALSSLAEGPAGAGSCPAHSDIASWMQCAAAAHARAVPGSDEVGSPQAVVRGPGHVHIRWGRQCLSASTQGSPTRYCSMCPAVVGMFVSSAVQRLKLHFQRGSFERSGLGGRCPGREALPLGMGSGTLKRGRRKLAHPFCSVRMQHSRYHP